LVPLWLPILALLASPLPALFYFPATPAAAICTLSLHDALPILGGEHVLLELRQLAGAVEAFGVDDHRDVGLLVTVIVNAESLYRSEEHTSELQSRENLVCRLLLEKKNNHVPLMRTPTRLPPGTH